MNEIPTADLIAELARRNAHIHPEDSFAPAYAMIVRACADVGFTPPREGETILDWADTVLDSPLAPRGCDAWAAGHAHTIDAMEAALHDNEPLCLASMRLALAAVRAHGNKFCDCVSSTSMRDDTTGRLFCMKCRLRNRKGETP